MGQSKYSYQEFSGALQQKSTTHIKKPNEVRDSPNVDFSSVIGAMRRRAGAQSTTASMPKLPIDAPALGAFIARFPTGNEIWAAQNDATPSPTQSKLYYFTGPGVTDWTQISAGLMANGEINMINDLDEVWVSQYNALLDTIGDPFTVDSSHSVSTTRHLDFAPKARFYVEYNGAIWAANVLVDGVRYRDRLYKSSGPTGVFAFVRAATTLTQTAAAPTAYAAPLEVDSVRYVKVGQVIDIYQAGTETKLYTLTVSAVDKALDTVSFGTPDTLTFANTDINTTSDVITIPTAAWAVDGTPVTFWQGTGLPSGLAQGTVYYLKKLSTTTITLHTTRADALAGTNVVDITTQGTGTHRLTFTPVFGNKDEFWKSGRKGKLSRFWNTDYRNPEAADWLKLPATLDAVNDITGIGVISSRMFWFTKNAMIRYDGQNRVPLRNDVGCISHQSIAYYDSFMVWLDAKGQIWIRNDEAGQQDVISEAIQDVMAMVPEEQLSEAVGVCVGKKYKLYLGQIDGKSLRVVYDFRSNQWSYEWFTPKLLQQIEYTYNGVTRPHFFDETGQMWVDEEGNDDNGEVIPFAPELGSDTFGMDELKSYVGMKIYSHASSATKVFVSIDDAQWIDVGQITRPVDSISLTNRQSKAFLKGTMLNIRLVDSSSHDPVQIDKITVWFNREEDTFRATPR